MSDTYRSARLRRDTLANIPVLAIGEPFISLDTHEFFLGTSAGNVKVNINYSPATPSNWSGAPPANLISALDRLAAAVESLLGGPIP